MNVNWAALAIGAIVIGGAAVSMMKTGADSSGAPSSAPSSAQTARVVVQVPEKLTLTAQKGRAAFAANCAACHGENAAGTDQGPPLVHDIYNPGHHSDEAFFLAAKRGVRAHHWPYGNMPALPQVTASEVSAIVAYVRQLQTANGIVARAHAM